ncbi:ATP-binding protein, partial [Streptomyces sp. NPDC047017]|uniref:sensor histidine kinase n=1 Tax=Streptomyces sp. NPDC047017 TaxID=3155024 RepID=UPI003401363C
MNGRRRPRTGRRGHQPRTLRTRLVVASLVLIAVVCAVIGTVTTLALRSHLYQQLDEQLREVAARASGQFRPPDQPGTGGGAGVGPGGGVPRRVDLADFVTKGPQPPSGSTVVARVEDGRITDSRRGEKSSSDFHMSAEQLTGGQAAALATVPQADGARRTVDLPGLGGYRVEYRTGPNGSYYVALPTSYVDGTINTLVLVEISVTVAGLIAASLAGAAIVEVALRPLRRVAATATRVSELPLHTGEVNLSERVPEPETDPRTEVGQVGTALNRMLDHIHGALHARQQSETRVRQFVADASHELRTPLASIRGYAELTRRGGEEVGPDTRHALARIESEAGRMTLLVEDLLLLARLDAGRPLRFEPTDLVPLVVDTVSDARAAGPDHTWRLDLPGEDVPASADAARLQQVLVNLLANARTHTPPGTTVTARVRRRGPWLCVDVEDDGPGIPPPLLPHVFERFARGDSARSRATGSTGLGLAIVQAVVSAHGGAVTVHSEPGRTAFTVRLPALRPAAAPGSTASAAPATPGSAAPGSAASAAPATPGSAAPGSAASAAPATPGSAAPGSAASAAPATPGSAAPGSAASAAPAIPGPATPGPAAPAAPAAP